MVNAGDVWIADIGGRRRIVALTGWHLARLTGRVVVAPEVGVLPGRPMLPSWVAVGKARFAIERMQSVPADRLLEQVGRATAKQSQRNERVVQMLFEQR